MADDFARRFATRQIELQTASLAQDAERLAQDARIFADSFTRGGSRAGGASRVAQAALLVLQQAAQLDAAIETMSYLAPAPKDQP